MDMDTSVIDGGYLLPNERLTKNNIGTFSSYFPVISAIEAYMEEVQTALYNYEQGLTTKIILTDADIQNYIEQIRSVTVRIGGGIDVDGVTTISAVAQSLLPDLLMTLRSHQMTLCALHAIYLDSQGLLLGPIDVINIESDSTGGASV